MKAEALAVRVGDTMLGHYKADGYAPFAEPFKVARLEAEGFAIVLIGESREIRAHYAMEYEIERAQPAP